ncbi:glycosyltransferase family 1 protein [Pseudomonas sp. SWRI92]|uniref:glycosyltransferase family 4 protein n=1 Tax=Pseudomonas sp. SWRI92 TaxID=2745499 RepID=UPI00320A92AF
MPVGSYELNVSMSCKSFDRYRSVRTGPGYDIFHSTYYRLPVERSCSVVTTVHDYTYERYSSGLRRVVHSWQKNKAIKGSDKIICVSESTRRDLLEFSGLRADDNVVVIHNGVSDAYYPLEDVSLGPQVLFVGARAGYKNFTNAVLALEGLSGVKLLCVGGGQFDADELDMLERIVPGRYSHAGYLTNEQLNLEYNRSICLVYPSLYEGFGIPVLEAMRAGCPVVAVNSSSIPEVAGDAAILLECGEVEEMRSAIEFFCVTDNRSDFVGRGRIQAEKFSWDETFNKTLAVYEELLGQKIWN